MNTSYGDPAHNLQAELKDLSKGPRPITLEEYRSRSSKKAEVPIHSVAVENTKKRGGLKVRFRKELANLYRLLVIADKSTKREFLSQINEIKQKRKQLKKEKKKLQNNVLGHGRERSNYQQQRGLSGYKK